MKAAKVPLNLPTPTASDATCTGTLMEHYICPDMTDPTRFFRPGLLMAAIVMLLASCTIEQTVYFNSDFSGTYQLRLDMSSLAAFGGDSLGTDTIFTPESLAEMSAAYSEVPGISEANSEYVENVLTSGFRFTGVSSLNQALTKTGEEEGNGAGLFIYEQKGKTVKIKVNRKGMDSMADAESEEMGDMITIALNLGFEQKIKKVKGTKAVWDKEKNTVSLNIPLKEFMDEKVNLDTEIRLK